MLHTHTQKERVKEKGKIVNFVNVNFENQSAKLARCSLQSDLKREREKKKYSLGRLTLTIQHISWRIGVDRMLLNRRCESYSYMPGKPTRGMIKL